MRFAALRAIRFYQRYLSPLKGYSCAYRVHTGADSCSAYGYRMIERFGLQKGWGLLRRRLRACASVACDCHAARPAAMPRQRMLQAGYCDLPCDIPACDLPACDIGVSNCAGDLLGGMLDVANCGCSGCDLAEARSSHRKKSREKDQSVKVLPMP